MTTLTIDSDEDSVEQARLLVGALTEWLKEQPEGAPPRGEAVFAYRPDGSLYSVLIVPEDGV
jgi:hypothetical protein